MALNICISFPSELLFLNGIGLRWIFIMQQVLKIVFMYLQCMLCVAIYDISFLAFLKIIFLNGMRLC